MQVTVAYRTPEQLAEFLRYEADRRGPRNKEQKVDDGQRGLICGRLNLALDGNMYRTAFLIDIFALASATDMNRAQYYALRDWLVRFPAEGEVFTKPANPDQQLNPQAYSEIQTWLKSYQAQHGQTVVDDTPGGGW